MYTVNHFISDEAISALGWTFVNILWQGFLIAFLLGLFLRIFKNISSDVRYYLALFSLFLIIAVSVFNFVAHYEPVANKEAITFNETIKSIVAENSQITIIDNNNSLKESLLFFYTHIDRYFPVFINIWMVGMLIFLVKLILGLLFIQRLKFNTLPFSDEQWINRFKSIEKKLSLDKRIKYLESTLVKIPMVLGYLKPVIIVPAGMLAGLPVNQIEAIIAHELAHIKRNDYLFNIFQSIIEMIYFFHPAVWYISSVVRTERENCCDDIALTVCDGSLTYAKALVSVQELNPGKVYSAVAFSGQKKQLLNRIKRMIMKPEMKSTQSDKYIAALIVIAGLLITTLSMSFEASSKETAPMVNDENFVNPITNYVTLRNEAIAEVKKPIVKIQQVDTIKRHQKEDHINIEDNTIIKTFRDKDGKKKEMKVKLKNGAIAELYIDDKKIPDSEFPKYQAEVDELISDLKEAKEDIRRAMKEVEEIDFEKIRKEVEESMKDVQIDMVKIQAEIAQSIKEAKEIDIEKIMKEVEANMDRMKDFDYQEIMKDVQESLEEIKHIDMEEIQLQMEEVRKQMENIDYDKIRAEIEKNRQEFMTQIDIEEIQKEVHKAQQEMAKIDMGKIRIEMEESFKHIDKDQLMKDMEKELEKLEGLELEKK
jgi:bla regulator protein blaR1